MRGKVFLQEHLQALLFTLSKDSYTPAQKAGIIECLVRLRVAIVAAPRLETTALAVLADIGKKKKPYLTELEEKLLATLEVEYLQEKEEV